MQFTHIYETGYQGPARPAERYAVGAALYPYRAFSEVNAEALQAKARFVDGLVRTGRTFVERTGRQQSIAAGAYADLLRVPFRAYGGTVSPAELEEDDMRGETEVREENRMLALADGTCVPVREIRPGDAAALQRLVGRLSERSVRLRYFGPMKDLNDRKARHFAEVDGVNRYALVALDPEDQEEIVAVVRYDRDREEDKAEYAALVEDRLQGKGLGIGLTRALIEAARERGIEDFEALVLPQNKGMISLLASLDLPGRVQWKDGIKHFSIDLFPERDSTS